METPRYRYKPLARSDEIRVLTLSTTTTRIETCILHVSLTSFGYSALSYVWGNPEQASKAILLDLETREPVGWLPLTKNLGNAMCDLRDAKELSNKFFWIDQLCINQQDEKEKSEQVAMMSQIYTQARQVITYLGPAGIEAEEEQGIWLLGKISSGIPKAALKQMHKAGSLERIRELILEKSIRLKQPPFDLNLADDQSLAYGEDEILRLYTEQGWNWLVRVAYGEWTQRLWIVQEQLLNKQITGLRGHRLVDWSAITMIPILFAIGYLPPQYRDACRRSFVGDIPLDELDLTIYGIWWDRHARWKPKTSYRWSTLLHNLQWYQLLLCGDPRDRVYAILAISQDSPALGIVPDYSSRNTVDTLSKHLSVRILETAFNLQFLSSSLSWRRPSSTLPSWCLTLDRPMDLNAPANIPEGVYAPHPISHFFPVARFSTNDSVLIIKGRILDRVSARIPTMARIHHPPQINFVYSLIYAVPNDVSIRCIASILRAITARALWKPSASTQASEDDEMVFHFWVYLRHLLRLVIENLDALPRTTTTIMLERGDCILTVIKALAPCNTYPDSQITDKIDKREKIALDRVLDSSLDEGRVLGRTDAGRLFNSVYTIQEGDEIVAFQGADKLFLIRPVEDTYRLIGDVFADGMMHGEEYRDCDPDVVDYDIELV